MPFFMAAVSVAGLAMSAYGQAQAGAAASASASMQRKLTQEAAAQDKHKTYKENAQSNLKNHLTAINNNRILRQAGKAHDAATTNMGRMLDSRSRNRLEQNIQIAEQTGAFAAHSAYTGTGGASTDAITSAMDIRNSRMKLEERQQTKQLTYDSAMQIAGIMPNAGASLDLSVHSGGTNSNMVQANNVDTGSNMWGTLGDALTMGGKMYQDWRNSQVTKVPKLDYKIPKFDYQTSASTGTKFFKPVSVNMQL